jgi:hypothetical protein
VALQQLAFHQHNSAMMMMLFSLCFHHSQTSIEIQQEQRKNKEK